MTLIIGLIGGFALGIVACVIYFFLAFKDMWG